MFVYIGSSGNYGRRSCRTVVERTFAGQRKTLFGSQEIRTAKLSAGLKFSKVPPVTTMDALPA